MAKKSAYLRSFAITQEFNVDYWSKADDELKSYLLSFNVAGVVNWINRQLYAVGWLVDESYGIVHDKDVEEVFSESLARTVVEPKRIHMHMCFRFAEDYKGTTLEALASVIGLSTNFVEKPKSGRYSWDNMRAYLIHAKDRGKHQYSPSEVFNGNTAYNYVDIYKANKDSWKLGALKKERKTSIETVEMLIDKILTGEVVRAQIFLTDEYYRLYTRNKDVIDKAFDTYGQRKMYKAIQDLKSGKFSIKVFFFYGGSGTGKTRMAKQFADELVRRAKVEQNEDWRICQTAATNPVDDYQGEEILLMDDVRGASMRAEDWLKLVDPYNMSPNSARYRNKTVVSRVIIITSVIHPVEFFYYSKGVGRGEAQAEAVDQFLRRLAGMVEFVDCDTIRYKETVKIDSPKDFEIRKPSNMDYGITTKVNYDFNTIGDNKSINIPMFMTTLVLGAYPRSESEVCDDE